MRERTVWSQRVHLRRTTSFCGVANFVGSAAFAAVVSSNPSIPKFQNRSFVLFGFQRADHVIRQANPPGLENSKALTPMPVVSDSPPRRRVVIPA